jgi:putative CocE/NonD family hydrolase
MSFASRLIGKRYGLPAATAKVKVAKNLRIPGADGHILLADRYYPADDTDEAGQRTPPPILLIRSPYGRRALFGASQGLLFAERGYQVVIQSCRGTFGSGGPFVPQVHEKADGLAALEWIRQQPWYGGTIATMGPSYLGYTQWAVAGEKEAQLAAIVPTITMPHFGLPTYDGGSFSLANCLEWSSMMANMQQGGRGMAKVVLAQLRGGSPALRRGMSTLPLSESDTVAVGRHVDFYQDWLTHGLDDEYWTRQDHRQTLANVTAPVLMVTGWYDIFLPWQIESYQALHAAGNTPRLVVGPWFHVSRGAAVPTVTETLAFLDAQVKGVGEAPEPIVRAFVTGEGGGWREYPHWPPPGIVPTSYRLQPGGGLSSDEPPADAEPDVIRYDPADPTPSLGGARLGRDAGVQDNRELEARADVLTYTGTPLAAPVRFAGTVTASIEVSSDRETFDIFVRLCDVSPSGVSTNVCDRLVRLAPDPQGPPGTVRTPRLELWPAAHHFQTGHRIRVQISCGAHPRYARNLGTGEPLATATTMLVATQHIHHDAAHPSSIVLPVLPAQAG